MFHKAVMNVYLICAKVENQPLDRKENNTKIRDKRHKGKAIGACLSRELKRRPNFNYFSDHNKDLHFA